MNIFYFRMIEEYYIENVTPFSLTKHSTEYPTLNLVVKIIKYYNFNIHNTLSVRNTFFLD